MRGEYICAILARSSANARRVLEILGRAGIPAELTRIPSELAVGSCGSAVTVDGERIAEAVAELQKAGLPPFPVYCAFPGERYKRYGG